MSTSGSFKLRELANTILDYCYKHNNNHIFNGLLLLVDTQRDTINKVCFEKLLFMLKLYKRDLIIKPKSIESFLSKVFRFPWEFPICSVVKCTIVRMIQWLKRSLRFSTHIVRFRLWTSTRNCYCPKDRNSIWLSVKNGSLPSHDTNRWCMETMTERTMF